MLIVKRNEKGERQVEATFSVVEFPKGLEEIIDMIVYGKEDMNISKRMVGGQRNSQGA